MQTRFHELSDSHRAVGTVANCAKNHWPSTSQQTFDPNYAQRHALGAGQKRQRLGYLALPACLVLDNQSVKTAPMMRQAKSFDGLKPIRGRKRHVLVDEAGLLVDLLVSRVNQGDSEAAEPLLSQLAATTTHRPSLLVDSVYPHTFVNWAA